VKAWTIRSGGGIASLTQADVEVPHPQPTEALVRMTAATLNFHDLVIAGALVPELAIPNIGSEQRRWTSSGTPTVRVPMRAGNSANQAVASSASVCTEAAGAENRPASTPKVRQMAPVRRSGSSTTGGTWIGSPTTMARPARMMAPTACCGDAG
jgi:hypothetical protein